jgi:hypothetical protein
VTPPRCEFTGCDHGHYANGLCMPHYRMQLEKGFLLPLGPAVRRGQRWTPEFAVRWATDALAYHAPDRLAEPFRPDPVPASPPEGGGRR